VAQPFEIVQETTVGATPEQVWDAITNGPHVDSWFMGRTRIEPREGGTAQWDNTGWSVASTVTAWEPPTRLAYRSPDDADGGFHSFEYQVEARPEATTVRWIHTGALAGDDWEREYVAMGEGDPMYFRKLIEYLTYFQGRTAVSVEVFGPNLGEGDHTWEVFRGPLALDADPEMDMPLTLRPDGMDPIEGVTDTLSKSFMGVRTDDAMYRFIVGFEGTLMVGHHLFAEGVDQASATEAWQAWFARAFA
jgi:uncharacterized protein YndB with AHSA1/START domain